MYQSFAIPLWSVKDLDIDGNALNMYEKTGYYAAHYYESCIFTIIIIAVCYSSASLPFISILQFLVIFPA